MRAKGLNSLRIYIKTKPISFKITVGKFGKIFLLVIQTLSRKVFYEERRKGSLKMSARSGRRIRKPSVRLRDSNFVVPGLSSEGTDDSAATKTVNFNPPRLMGVANGEDVLNPLLREEARQEGQAKSFRVFKGALRFHVAKVKFEEKKRDREYEVKTEKSKVADAKTRKGGSGIKVEEEEEQYAEGASSTPQSRELERNSGKSTDLIRRCNVPRVVTELKYFNPLITVLGQAEMSAEIVMAPVSQTPMSGGFNGGEKVVKGEKLKRAADATPTAVPSKAQKREDNLIIVDGTKYVECQVCHKNLKLGEGLDDWQNY